jgi:metal-sulfur cluster biosynthetic enzyme
MIEDQICAALTGGPAPVAADYRINWVWMPPWGPEKITADGRYQLRAIGFNI